MMIKTLVFDSFAANCYIIASSSTNQGMIIDPRAEEHTILKTVHQIELSISLIVATHTHPDRIGALRAV